MLRCVLALALLLLFAPSAHATRIDEEKYVSVGGIEQWVTFHGADRRNPALLVLHGGPAEVQTPLAEEYAPFERDFVVVQWDQRGAGRTLMKSATLEQATSIELLVKDTIDLAEKVRAALPSKDVVLVGHSFGSMLGVLAVKARPDLFLAFVGTGQVVGWDLAVAAQYRYTLARARAEPNPEAVADLEKQGPPPPGDFERYGGLRKWLFRYFAPADLAFIDKMGKIIEARLTPTPDVLHAWAVGYKNTMKFVGDALVKEDLPALGPDFALPFFVIDGREDCIAPVDVATAYVEDIRAPVKRMTLIDGAGHFVMLTHTTAFLAALKKDVALARAHRR